MTTVALAVTDGMLHFELALPCEVFGSGAPVGAHSWYSLSLCGPGAVRVGRFRIEPDHGLDRLASVDTVIVPGWADGDSHRCRKVRGPSCRSGAGGMSCRRG